MRKFDEVTPKYSRVSLRYIIRPRGSSVTVAVMRLEVQVTKILTVPGLSLPLRIDWHCIFTHCSLYQTLSLGNERCVRLGRFRTSFHMVCTTNAAIVSALWRRPSISCLNKDAIHKCKIRELLILHKSSLWWMLVLHWITEKLYWLQQHWIHKHY